MCPFANYAKRNKLVFEFQYVQVKAKVTILKQQYFQQLP